MIRLILTQVGFNTKNISEELSEIFPKDKTVYIDAKTTPIEEWNKDSVVYNIPRNRFQRIQIYRYLKDNFRTTVELYFCIQSISELLENAISSKQKILHYFSEIEVPKEGLDCDIMRVLKTPTKEYITYRDSEFCISDSFLREQYVKINNVCMTSIIQEDDVDKYFPIKIAIDNMYAGTYGRYNYNNIGKISVILFMEKFSYIFNGTKRVRYQFTEALELIFCSQLTHINKDKLRRIHTLYRHSPIFLHRFNKLKEYIDVAG